MSSRLNGRVLHRALAFVFLSIALSFVAFAQSTTEGAVGGTIYDQRGAVIANATVVVHNNGTNAEQTVTTDASGYYRVTKLAPATYTVSVNAPGFAPYRATNVTVNVGTLTDISPRLNVGTTTATVDVTAEAPQINTTSADFAPTVDQTSISNLPINGNRWSSFVLLTPGVVNDANGFGLVSFRGMSALLNNNTVDGADNNQAFFSEERGRTRAGYSTPKFAIQEFQANTSNYSAEYGRSAGGVINTVTKSGTNNLHGEMYFFDRDNDWGAKNPFTKIPVETSPGTFTAQIIKPKDWRKIAGISLGGPIKKDKLFFHFAFDWFDHNFPGVGTPSNATQFFAPPSCSPNPATGVCSANTTIGLISSRVFGANTAATNAQATALYNQTFSGLASMLGTVTRDGEQYIVFPKVDWQINQKNHFSILVNRMRWASPAGIQTQANVQRGIASFGNDFVKDTWGVAKLDTFISNSLANEFRAQYGRDFEFEDPQPPTPFEANNLVKSPLFPGYTNPFGLPPDVVGIPNGFEFGVPTFLTRPKFPDERRQQYADTLTWAYGKHTIKAGIDYTHVHDRSENLFSQFGSFRYSSIADFVTDANKVNGCSGRPCYNTFTQGFGPLGFSFNTNDYAFFGQDDWRVLPRLTLSLGLRWEYEQLPDPFANLVNPAVSQTGRLPSDKNNFGPRFGFAWDVFGNGKTALRGGWGMYYGRVINSTIFNALTGTGMAGGQFSFSLGPTSAGAPSFPQILTTQPANPSTSNIVFFDRHFQLPQIHQIDLTLEQDVGWNTVVSFSYLGSLGRDLPDFVDANISRTTTPVTFTVCGVNNDGGASCGKDFGSGPLQSPTFTVNVFNARNTTAFGAMTDIFSGVTSKYNALAVQVNHRMSRHVQAGFNYTWSHALDSGVNGQTFSATNLTLNPFDRRADFGNSSTNVPQRVVFHAVAESPWKVDNKVVGFFANDWQIAPLFQWQNGLPFSFRTSGNAPGSIPGAGGLNGSGGDFRLPGFGRNNLRQPNTHILDLKLSKNIHVRDRYTVELSGEAFNLLNHFNVTGVNSTAYFVRTQTLAGKSTPTLVFNSGVFGTTTNANSNFAYTPRQVQLGVRIKF